MSQANPQSAIDNPQSIHAVGFELLGADPSCAARRARLHTPHGSVELPTFMPVGTVGAVKGVEVDRVRETGAQIVLGNTYHLTQRPGEETVAKLGGLHRFTGWTGPMLTDSGGFQVFSLSSSVKVDEQGATFQSQHNGDRIHLTPERSVEIQEALGSDIAMVLDHVPPLPSTRDVIADTMQRSVRWARRCQEHALRDGVSERQSLFAIVQGGLEDDLRQESAEQLVEMEFAGYAVGGLSVGEAPEEMYRAIEATTPFLPQDRPRYLMGVGTPTDLLEAIGRGIDMFDCVMPTRNGRNGLAFTAHGPLRLRNRRHVYDTRPLEEDCPCPACQRSRGYLAHLFRAKEMLGPILLSIHNLTYYQRLMAGAREAIEAGRFLEFKQAKQGDWAKATGEG
ncbi:MAG: tRNA guanosine(34) transglycosylase Tgt [Planctomycetota bacterium]